MNQHPDPRNIRIFISSTFEDMKAERDYLITKIFPRLAAEATKRNVTLIPLDLRWGILEEESQSGKVIEICLQEIEQSRPFFIGLLGNRYGWCPPKEELLKNTNLQERYGWIETDISQGLSVTEIEIQYGVLRNPEQIDAFFYIRNDGQTEKENPAKLQRLKSEIRNDGRYPVSEYRSPEELGAKVEKAFMQLLDERFPNRPLSNLEKERLAQLAFLHSRCETYIPQAEALTALNNFLQEDGAHNLVVTGESGMGKSSLIANWLGPLLHDKHWKVIYHFTGNGNAVENHLHIIQRLCDEIRDLYHLSPDEAFADNGAKPEDRLQAAYNMIAMKGPLLIVLDGINQLAEEGNAKQLLWLPPATKNVKYVFSTLPDDKTMEVFANRKYPVFHLQPMQEEQQRELVGLYLKHYGKKLTAKQVNRIIRNPHSRNTLLLRTLLDELIVFGNYAQLDNRIDYYLQTDSTEDFFQRVLQRFEDDFTAPQVRNILSLIAFSRSGLSEQEIMDITGIRPYHWSQFYCAFRVHLTQRNGLQTFSHRNMARAVQTRYAKQATNAKQKIVQYFKQRQSERAWDELPHQYYELKEPEALYHFLLNLKVNNYLFPKDPYELGKYWRMLLETDKERFTPEAYLHIPGNENIRAVCYTYLGSLFSNQLPIPRLALLFQQQALDLYKSVGGRNNYTLSLLNKYMGKAYTVLEDYDKALHHNLMALELLDTSNRKDKHSSECYNNIGTTYTAQGKYDKTLEYLQQSLDINREINGEEHPGTALCYSNIGDVYYKMRQYRQSLEYHEKALEINKLTLGETSVEVANCHNNIGTIYNALGQYTQALELYTRTLHIYTALFGEKDSRTALCYNNIGLSYDSLGDYAQGWAYYQKALAITQGIFGESHTQVALIHNNLGYNCQLQGKYDDALNYYGKALHIYKDLSDESHPDVALCYNNIGLVYYNLGNYEKAAENTLKALDIYKTIFGEKQLDIARCYNNLGAIFNAIKDFETANIYYENALSIYISAYGEKHPDIANCYNNIGYNHSAQQQYDKALDCYRKAVEIYQDSEENGLNIASCYNNIGLTYFHMKEYEKALKYYEKAIDIFQVTHNQLHPLGATCYYNTGYAKFLLGEKEEAAVYFRKSQEINKAIFGEHHPTVATFDNYIKQIYANDKQVGANLTSGQASINTTSSKRKTKGDGKSVKSLFKKLFGK